MGETTPELRVGDSERRVVDDRLMAAVGDGVLTLAEYDERAAVLWQARTRTELDVLTADLGSPAVPGARPDRRARRAGLAHRVRGRLSGLLVPVVVLGGVLLAGPDSAAVFGSSVERVSGNDDVAVSTLFGSVQVVVPDGARVETSGFVLFGSVDCRACDVAKPGGAVVSVRSVGGFGSVEIVTVSQKAAEDADASD